MPNSPPLFATTIWANPLRTTPETLADILAADNVPFEPGDAKLYLVNHDHQPPASPQPNASGILLFMRTRVRNPKLTTVATSLLGHTAARN